MRAPAARSELRLSGQSASGCKLHDEMNRFVALLLLSTALLTHEPAPAHADEVLPPVQDSHSLLLQLQRFVEQRGIDV
jgi:hypothetical protein